MRTLPNLQDDISTLSSADLLKVVLENLTTPERLDSHPWAQSWMVVEECKWNPALRLRSPGMRLAITIALMFRRMLPSAPPRHGKRLDTRWGEYGILASKYFVPFIYGKPYPASLREAWYGIDEAIQLFVFDGKTASGDEQRAAYRLVANEPESAPESTISDWHRKGVQRLAQAVESRQQHERYHGLVKPEAFPRIDSEPAAVSAVRARREMFIRQVIRIAAAAIVFLLVLGLFLAGQKVWRLYEMAGVLQNDAALVRELAQGRQIAQAGAGLSRLRADLESLRREAEPVLWLGPTLGWLPVYGGDLASAPLILDMAESLVLAADEAYGAAGPVLEKMQAGGPLDLPGVAQVILQAHPRLTGARTALEKAQAARTQIELEALTPGMRRLIVDYADPALLTMEDGLAAALTLPRLMGASGEGPKTYLLLAQNEDELRSTGGFITAAGTLTVEGGRVIAVKFEDSGNLDNWTKPFPAAPWQLQEYMNSPVLVLRDSNWFTDFPTSALYAEDLFAYTNAHSVDGVIAFDQYMLVLLLEATGPIQVDGVEQAISAENVIAYMRSAKSPPPGQPVPVGWSSKGFMDKITSTLLAKIFQGEIPWQKLAQSFLQGLNERHLLLQLDDPDMQAVLQRHGWNGALRPGAGDFLMVADSNIGFNKTSAVVDTLLYYDVNLTGLSAITAQLTVVHKNNSSPEVNCLQWGAVRFSGEEKYPINACYWNYMRFYRPAGTELLGATPQSVPAEWMILRQAVEPKVDVLEEQIDGIQGFGTLMVVPGGEELTSGFKFSLPEHVLQVDPASKGLIYSLKVLKQPGTRAIPLAVRIQLPAGASIETVSAAGLIQGENVLFETELRTDIEIRVVFTSP